VQRYGITPRFPNYQQDRKQKGKKKEIWKSNNNKKENTALIYSYQENLRYQKQNVILQMD